jgi:hypothetical protein
MPDEFDSAAAAQNLAELVKSTSATVRAIAPPATPAPLFHKLQDGSVTDSKGKVLVAAPKPVLAKGT